MKTTLLSFSAAICFIIADAQSPITITGADLPQAGQDFILANDTAPNILLGTPGSSPQTWDFTGITNHYYKAAVYDLTSSTPYAAEFPLSNIYTFGPSEYFGALYGGAPVSSGYDGYMFWSSDNSGLKVIGWKAIDGPYAYIPIHENPAELLIGTPASYGTNFTDSSRWDMFLGDVPSDVDTTYVSHRNKTLSCDAWGMLNTPFGNFPDVIRIHETVAEIDSAIATLAGNTVYAMEIFRDTSNNYMYMANGVGYPLAIVHCDKYNNIKDIEYLIDTTCAVYSEIMGTIADTNGSIITDGTVYLYQFIDDFTPMLFIDSVSIDSNGFYAFFNLDAGYYIVSAEANISVCPACIPTYYGDVTFWENAGWLNTFCIDTLLADIWLTQLLQMNGSGFCGGNIQFGPGKTVGDPVPGIDVSVEQVPGGIKAHTTTDQNGNFSFNNIDTGTYKVLVDFPGLPMDSTYQFTVTSTDSSFTNLNFTIDTTAGSGAVYVGYPLGIKAPISNFQFPISIYPNPSDGVFQLSVSSYQLSVGKIEIYNIFGEKIYQQPITDYRSPITINLNHPAGIYFWKVFNEDGIVGTGKISVVK